MRIPDDNHHEPQQPNTPEHLRAHHAWIHGHWAFFILIQAAIINLTRLKLALDRHDSAKARRLFEQTSALMLGSAVAMQIAGDMNPESYQKSVIPSMKAARPKFSGSDSSDHAELIRCYQVLTAPLTLLDTELTLAYLRFVAAVRTAKEAHKYVCGDHGGNDRPSTGSGCKTEMSGVETLEKLGAHRIAMLMPDAKPSRCPFHSRTTTENKTETHYMKTIRYTIAPAIFEKVPAYIRGLVVMRGTNNTVPNPGVQAALRDAERHLASSHNVESLLADPRIANWREAFKLFGMNPSEFRPAHEALGRRAVQAKPLPFINSLVDIGNAMSLEYLMPIGVHPIENVAGQLALKRATGNELFKPFGSDKLENPKPGEVIFADDVNVHARAWVWRQGQCSVTLPTTSDIVVHVDALPPTDMKIVESVCEDVANRIQRACSGLASIHIISAAKPVAII